MTQGRHIRGLKLRLKFKKRNFIDMLKEEKNTIIYVRFYFQKLLGFISKMKKNVSK